MSALGDALGGINIDDPREDLDDDNAFSLIDGGFVIVRGCSADGQSQWGYSISENYPRDALIGQLVIILDRLRAKETGSWKWDTDKGVD